MKNMLNKTFAVLVFILLGLSSAKAQETIFNVVAAGGKAEVKNVKTGEWLPLKLGARLSRGNVIRLGKNDLVGLVHSNGKSIELKAGGTYELDALDAKIGKEGNSITKNIANYVMNEMVVNQKSSQNMKMLGAVVRAGLNTIELNSPVSTNLIEPLLTVSWFPSNNSTQSVFHLISPDGKTIYMQTTMESSLNLDMRDFNLQKEMSYRWFISSGNNNTIISDTACFYLLSEKKISGVKDTLASLKSESIEEGSILESIYLAAFYEQNSLNSDALRLYEKIYSQPVQVEGFKNKFVNFLINTGMQARAQIVANETDTN